MLVAAIAGEGLSDTAALADPTTTQQSQLATALAATRTQLNSAVATDAQVQGAVSRLSGIVSTNESALATAEQSLATTRRNVDATQRRLTIIKAQLAATRLAARRAAIEMYVSGGGTSVGGPAQLLTSDPSRSAEAATYGKVVLDTFSRRFSAFELARANATATARELQATESRAAVQLQLVARETSDAKAALAVQSEAHLVLQRRIADFRHESADLAAEQRQIAALIAAREAAQRQAAQAATSSTAGSSGVPSSAGGSGLIWPLQGVVTSPFGPRWGGFHPGIDISDPTGTPIHAAGNGTVIFAGWYGGYGNFVLIDNGGGIVTGYAHQSQIAVGQGDGVRQGQVIGYVGSTGDSTGPHLHFEVRVDGTAENPTSYVPGSP